MTAEVTVRVLSVMSRHPLSHVTRVHRSLLGIGLGQIVMTPPSGARLEKPDDQVGYLSMFELIS